MQIQSICETLGDYGCATFSFLYAIGIDPFIIIKDFNDLVRLNLLSLDATIQDYDKLAAYYGKKVHVYHDEPGNFIKDKLYLGRFVRYDFNHFVVMKNNSVIWNPLDYSKCVEQGTLKDIRVIEGETK